MNENFNDGRYASLYDLFFGLILYNIYHIVAKVAKKYNCKSIIDLGSGTGAQARILASYGLSVTGVDLSSKMIDVARKKTNDSIEFLNEDIRFVTPAENIFDAANLSLVLHSNSIQNIDEIISKTKTLIKKNGLIEPEEVLKYTMKYKETNDIYLSFINEHLIKDKESKLNINHLYSTFKGWYKEAYNNKPPPRKEMKNYFIDNYNENIRNNYIYGFNIKEDENNLSNALDC